MKIAIIGYSGSGKSTLAQYLGEKFKAQVLHLDCVHWLPGWVERPKEEEIPIINEFLDHHTSWVIDGNYSGMSYERRMEEADRILILDFNRFTCLCRAMKRFFEYRGRSRESIAEGCPEKMDLGFAWWILRAGRKKKQKDRYREVLRIYGSKAVVLRNQRQLTAYREAVEKKAANHRYSKKQYKCERKKEI